MTNDQQTTLGQVSGSEPHQLSQQQQENIQLTELLPVEQSRIKDNPGDRDQETTDGLKALRSFSRGEQEVFEAQREYVNTCFQTLETSYEENDDDDGSEGDRGNSLKKRKSNGDSRITGFRITRRIAQENERAGRLKNSKNSRKRRKNDTENNVSSDENEKSTKDPPTKRNHRVNNRLDPEVEDEVYSFRQQQHDPSETSNNDENDESNLEILSAGVYRDMANNFSDFSRSKDSQKCPEASTKKSKNAEKPLNKNAPKNEKIRKKRVSLREKRKGKDSDEATNESPDASLSKRNEAETDLRLKIDGIIQANYLLGQENNNVVQRNHNEIKNNSENPASGLSKEAKEISGENNTATVENPSNKKESSSQEKTQEQAVKKYFCLVCPATFKGGGGLRNHYKVVHAAGPVYKCDDCGKEFPLKERLKLHVRTHTGFKPYKCPDCHKSFARGGQLVQHRGTHSKVKPYNCNLCAGTFTCAANLALHVKRHNGQKDHKCEICGRGFVRKDALKKHLECLHRDVKSFLCVICNKTFKGHLPQHMRTHAQDRPHGCATCGQRFAQKSQLTVHQRTHSGQRPFRCLVCWQAFAHSTALKLHTRRHTGERPFKCTECNAGFTQLPHWKKHMKCIHGRSEPYSCKNCNSFFRIKNDLESHEKSCPFGEHVDELGKIFNTGVDTIHGKNSSSTPLEAPKFRVMNVERMRLLLAVLLKRISKPERLEELGFGKRLIDEVLQDSLVSAGKEPSRIGELNELESLRKNLESFLEWTVPKEHWNMFQKMKKTPEEILETLTAT